MLVHPDPLERGGVAVAKGKWFFVEPLIPVLIILVSRPLIYFGIGIKPELRYILNHWQNLDLSLLNSNLLSSIYRLHSQPPVWNTILGISSKVCSSDAACVLETIHLFNISLTIFTSIMLSILFTAYRLPKFVVVVSSSLYTVLPSTIYYENYAFYPHFTMFLISFAIFSSYSYIRNRDILSMTSAFVAVLVLSWTWGIFHPLIMIAVLLIIFSMGTRTPAKFAILFAMASCLFLPSIKNQIEFGFFGNSSWLGLNLSQVAPEPGRGCRFDDFRRTLPQIAHDGTAFNDPSIIPYAARCMDEAKSSISQDVGVYILQRARRFLASTKLTSSDYPLPPKAFESYPRISGNNPIVLRDGSINYKGIACSTGVLSFNLVLFSTILVSPFRSRRDFRSLALISVVFLLIVVGLGHLANGREQERMRYSINSVLYFVFTVSSYSFAKGLIRRERSPIEVREYSRPPRAAG
jgi:hypothetical protein